MAVPVKPNGLFGKACMAAIAPFRHLFVYPPLMRRIGQTGQAGMPQDSPPAAQDSAVVMTLHWPTSW